MIFWPGYSYDAWRRLREQLLHETSEYLTYHLKRPETWIQIPAVPVGAGGSPTGFAERFWRRILFDDR